MFTQFWQELKRRKVFKVAAMYAATSFVIMEAGDIMLPRLGLPEWTVTFIIILLIIGFPITLILSWVFDITPEGVKKTESLEEVQSQNPHSFEGKRSLAAIMFADLVGFTSMMAKDEHKTLEALEKIRIVLKPLIKEYNGKWQKELGDGSLSSFTSAVDAVQCAMDFQKAVAKENFKIRIGIHVGEVTMTEDDIFGDGVNIAARIEPLGIPGGICISDRVFEDISNNPEMKTALLGERELKNVERPIKIYTLIGDGLPDPSSHKFKNSPQSTFKNLWKRRMPQILFIYLLTSFILVQLVKWILDRFMLSPHWSDFTWILLLSLLPSIALMSFFHGNSGIEKWVRTEKIFIPVNLVAAGIILLILFQGKDLGAMTQEISMEDDAGNTIKRIIPKNEFIKNIAIFDFENKSTDEHADWLSYGMGWLIKDDLEQDMFINHGFYRSIYDELQDEGIKEGDIIPFELKRDIAKRLRMNYFLDGNYIKNNDGYEVDTRLFRTSNGALIAAHSLKGQDLFKLTDQLVVKFKEDLKLPPVYIESTEDRPISSLLTANMDAFENYAKALGEITYRNDWETGINYLNKALQIDPDFTYANFNLALFYYYSSKNTEATICINQVMDKIYMLPEKFRFDAKESYYRIHGDFENVIKTQEMIMSLYPNDVETAWWLSSDYMRVGENAKAELVLKSALEYDDFRGELIVSLAESLNAQGKKDEALSYYQLYAEKYPTHSRSSQLLGGFYFEQGNLEEAKINFEKSLILSVNNYFSLSQLAAINEKQGLFDEAEEDYHAAIRQARNPEDSIDVLNKQMVFYVRRGQIQQAFQCREEILICTEKIYPAYAVLVENINTLYLYYLIEQQDQALDIIHQAEMSTVGSLPEEGLSFAYFTYYLHQKNIPKAEEELDKFAISSQTDPYLENILLHLEGDFLFQREEFENATEKYQAFEKYQADDLYLKIKIAKCHRHLDKKSEAKDQLNKVLQLNPYFAEAHLLMAKILLDQNKQNEARDHLLVATRVWEKADKAFDKAQEANKLLADL